METAALWAIVLAIVCNVTCALLGCFLVLRRMSMIGDAISHAVLPGIVVAYLYTNSFGAPIVIGAMLMGFLTAFLTQALHSTGKVTEDSGMGIVFAAFFALGVILVTRAGNAVDLDVDCVLTGRLSQSARRMIDLFGFEVPGVLRSLGVALLLTLLFLGLFWKELKITSFDPALATSMGISATLMHYLLMGLVGGVTVAAFEAVGSILVIAMLIVPAACAHLLTDRLGAMLCWSSVVAVIVSVVGYLGADVLNMPESGLMAVSAGVLLLLAVLFAPRHGIISKKWRNWQLRLRIVSEDVLALLYRREESGAEVVPASEVRPLARGLTGRLALARLKRQSEIHEKSAGGYSLTSAGRLRATSLVRAHRLWETYLDENLALPRDHLHEVAHRMEHFIGPQLQQEIAREVQHPDVDPHGRTIPPSNV